MRDPKTKTQENKPVEQVYNQSVLEELEELLADKEEYRP